MADGRDQGTGVRDRGADNDRAGRVFAPCRCAHWRPSNTFINGDGDTLSSNTFGKPDAHTHVFTHDDADYRNAAKSYNHPDP